MRVAVVIGLILLLNVAESRAQVYLRADLIGKSPYRDGNNEKIEGTKGSAQIYQMGFNLPFAVKMDAYERPQAWGVALNASYTALHNQQMQRNLSPDEIMNIQLSLLHMRSISEKWSFLAMAGAGIYTSHARFSDIRGKNIMGHGGAVFIWHGRKNLQLGAGLALNTSFGFPMAFPALMVNWKLDGKYEVEVNMLNAIELAAGIKLNDQWKVRLIAEMSGSMTLEELDEREVMFSHQYVLVGLQPVLAIGKSISIPITIGMSTYRAAFYEERTLKAFFTGMGREYDPCFQIAPAFSVAIRYGF
ncbi:MAG: DUF6268 family outer membrane beta-barrel protein [Tannerellaceae bacterium]|nr:DUF6268 family outer membrane beta-barrel protein [Tannerellaceae bacterium]